MPLIRDSKWITLLRFGNVDEFNRLAAHEPPDLANADLRMIDLRKADLSHANMRDVYLRNADMRGLDLSMADLEGASLHDASVAGVLFPRNLRPEEIQLSLVFGTRMRSS